MTETEHPNKWQVAGAAVVARRAALGMQQADLVRASRVSDLTIRQFERGEGANMRPATRQRIALALGWPADAFDGDELPAVDDGAQVVNSPDEVAALRRRVEELAADLQQLTAAVVALGGAVVRPSAPTRRAVER